jgi:hypothetical protein
MIENIPKFKLIALPSYITDLFMLSLDMDEEVKEPKVRNIYRLFFISTFLLIITGLIIKAFLHPYLGRDIILTYYYRLYHLLISLYFIILILMISFRHYKYLFMTGKDLNLINVVIFYSAFVGFFGSLYYNIYLISPLCYNIENPLWQPGPFFANLDFKTSWLSKLDFIIYSSCSMFSISYPRIVSNSMIVSVVNVFQVMIGISLIALFISTFVQKSCSNK